jgi:predicted unusual protein kinase regulating ubiquinone biosynthesis (AarF/ABC1/UbiB family)
MAVLLNPERLKRYKDVALLLIKYGRSDLVRQAGLEEAVELDEIGAGAAAASADELAGDLEKLGPTFIKLGQLLSTRADLLPGPYLEALSRLQDQIEPFSYEEVERIVLRELDFKIEAENLATISQNLAEFEAIVIPEPVDDFCTSRVLTMEYIQGKKITTLSPLRLLELDGSSLADELFRAYLRQFLVDGLFHADPHPGNVFVTDDDRIALLDLGMVGHVSRTFQDNLLRLLLAISEGRGDDAAEAAIKMGEPKEGFDQVKFTQRVTDLVAENRDAVLSRLNAGKVTLEITKISADCWFRLPPEFTMVAKALLNLDRVVYTLDPTFDPNAVIRERSVEILQRNILKSVAPNNLLAGVVDIKEFVEKLPPRVNKILDTIGNNDLRFKVDAIDEKVLLDGLQKVANRITLGLVLAALIVGASMLARVETSFRILGYPGLAMIFFLLAAAAGLLLVFSILFYDEKPNSK